MYITSFYQKTEKNISAYFTEIASPAAFSSNKAII